MAEGEGPLIVDHDVHVHTFLSACCNDDRLTPAAAIDNGATIGLKTIGFANHVWDSAVPGASKWYGPQDVGHVMQIREMIPADTRGIRVLLGCESEYCGAGKVGLTTKSAALFDYVLLPMSHFQMSGGFIRPKDLAAPEDVASLLMRRFNEAVEIEFITGIAHPLLPIGFMDHADRIMSLISDAQLADGFGRAAELGVSIEFNTGMFPGSTGRESRGFHDDAFIRVMSLARQAGCFFHFGSDAHNLNHLDGVVALGKYADHVGVTSEDIHPVFRPRC